RAAHGHVADRGGDVVGRFQRQPVLLGRQAALVEHMQAPAIPAQWRKVFHGRTITLKECMPGDDSLNFAGFLVYFRCSHRRPAGTRTTTTGRAQNSMDSFPSWPRRILPLLLAAAPGALFAGEP